MNHLPRSHVVQNHRGRITICDAVGDRKEVFGLTHEKFCKAAVHGERSHARIVGCTTLFRIVGID
jgi:hypothetical protein